MLEILLEELANHFLQQEERTAILWERVGIDYTDMGKSTEGYSKILVMIDHATKFVIAKTNQRWICRNCSQVAI